MFTEQQSFRTEERSKDTNVQDLGTSAPVSQSGSAAAAGNGSAAPLDQVAAVDEQLRRAVNVGNGAVEDWRSAPTLNRADGKSRDVAVNGNCVDTTDRRRSKCDTPPNDIMEILTTSKNVSCWPIF
jgi:hypothetical protein